MKILFKILLIVFMFYGCVNGKKEINQFSSSSDTLVIRTEKQKGRGLFLLGASPLDFRDTLQFKHSMVLPKHLKEIRYVQKLINFSSKKRYCIDIIDGIRDGKKVFVVDENNNKDFTDDSVRIYRKIKWFSTRDLIKCKYLISSGKEAVEDSSWINIGTVRNSLYFGRSEHLISNFKIDKENYQVNMIDFRAGDFTYGIHSEISLLLSNRVTKDTLLKKDILKLGESLNLNGNYYRFENISNIGEYITLIKENNFEDKIGLQIGMNAPGFEAISISGDTINSEKLNDKVTLIANACGCGGDKMSTKAYYDIENSYSDKINLIALDSKIDKNTQGVFIDVDEKFNKDIYNKYRQAYCSRVCYVIGKNNRIIDKFAVADWESNLPKLLN